MKTKKAQCCIPAADVSGLVAFLGNLTGEAPAQFANAPNLPAAAYKY